MKKFTLGTLLLSLFIDVFAQVDTTLIYNTSMPYGTLDLRIAKSATRYYYLQEEITFSFRQNPDGTKTNTFRDMTASWNSSPYGQGHMREKNGNADQFVLNYRILFPQNYDPAYDPGYPIIVMLHGAGETGNCWGTNCHWADPYWNPNTNNPPAPTDQFHELLNNDRNLFHGGLPHLNAVNAAGTKLPNDPTLSSKAFPGIVLFPQSLNGWSQPAKVEEAIKLVRLVIKKYNVDPNRVYIHGLSNGGWGVNQALKRAPWLFACALTMSAVSDAEIPQHNQLPEVAKLPLWVFQGGQDTNPTPSKTFNWVKKLRDAGAVVRYYLYPSLGHGTWNTAYKEPDFFPWILSQRKYNPHVTYGTPVICNTTGTGVKIAFSKGFLAYQWEKNGEVLTGEQKEELVADTPGIYRGRFSRLSKTPNETQWEPWSDPIAVTEVNPQKPSVIVEGTTHLRGPGLSSSDVNNTVKLKSSVHADLYDWYKNGQLINFQNTDIDDTLKVASITSGSTIANGAYTLVIRDSYCPSPASDPVQLFFNNSAPQNITITNTTFGLQATPGSSTVFLTWKDVVENEIGYEIWRRKQGTTTFSFAGRTAKDAISFLDKGLQPSSAYEYKVRAVSKTGRSNYIPSDNLSTNFLVTTLADQQTPTPPQNLTTTYNTVSSITIKWEAATDDNGIKEYLITYGTSQVTVPANALTYTIQNLEANTNYPITIQAVDYAGHVSQPSNQVIATTFVSGLYYKHSTGVWADLDDTTMLATFRHPEFTGWVTNFTLTPRTQEDFFNFQFQGYLNIPDSGKYIFRVTSDDGSRLLIDSVTIVDNDGKHGNKTITSDSIYLEAGLHTIEVAYFDNEGNQNLVVQYKGPGILDGNTFINIPEAALKSGEYITPVAPDPPGNLMASATAMNKVELSWEASPSENVKYEIFRAEKDGAFIKIANSALLTFADSTNVNPGTSYSYVVKATNENGTSSASNISTLTTSADTEAPTTPSNVVALSKSATSIALSWTAASDNDDVASYEIYVNEKLIGTSENTQFTITGLNSNTYMITVKAVDQSGNTSEMSSPIVVDNTIPGLYYSTANGDLTSLSTWKKTSDGTGNSPVNFTDAGQTFVIINRNNAELNNAWNVSSGSKVVVSDSVTLNIKSTCNCTIELKDNAILNLENAMTPQLGNLSPSSTINFVTPVSIPDKSYGTLILSGTGPKKFTSDSTIINGNLIVNDNIVIAGPDTEPTLTVWGDVIFNETGLQPVATQNVHLLFVSNALHTVQLSYDIQFSKISVLQNSTLKWNSSEPITLSLGNNIGGGLILYDGSVFDIAKNNLVINGSGAINPSNTNGKIAYDNSSIAIKSSTDKNLHLYSDNGRHTTAKLEIETSGSGAVTLENELSVRESVKLVKGNLVTKGYLKLLSTSDKTAAIEKIENGLIQGAVIIQQYYPPAGLNIIREIALPVEGVKVEKLQQIFPVTGNFVGASPGSSEPSMFTSTGSLNTLKEFPATGSSNQQTLQVGKGYTVNMLTANDTSALVIEASGLPKQGQVAVPLIAGNGTISSGWNLVGNPFASNVLLDNTISRTGLSDIIAISHTHVENEEAITQYRYYNLKNDQVMLKTGEAFWIQSAGQSPSLTFTESSKTNSGEIDNPSMGGLTIALTQAEHTDATYIDFSENAADEYEPLRDAAKRLNTGMVNIATRLESYSMAVNVFKKDECPKVVLLSLTNVTDGNLRMTFTGITTLGMHGVKLTDKFLNKQMSVSEGFVYDFAASADVDSYQDRFELTFSPSEDYTPQIVQGNFCFGDDAIVEITNPLESSSFILSNLSGQVISEGSKTDGIIKFTVPKTNLSEGGNALMIITKTSGCQQAISTPYTVTYPSQLRLTTTTNDLTICQGSHANLSVQSSAPIKTYQWMNSNFETIATTNIPAFAFGPVTSSSAVFLTGVNENECHTDTVSYTINVQPGPQPNVTLVNDTLMVDVSSNSYQWYRNGSLFATTSEPYIVLIDSGVYSVNINTGVCVAGSNALEFFSQITATEPDIQDGFSFEIFPVPNEGQKLYVEIRTHDPSEMRIEFLDMMGSLHEKLALNPMNENGKVAINFSKPLFNGVYIIRLTRSRKTLAKKFTVRN
jgi:chitodextrinase